MHIPAYSAYLPAPLLELRRACAKGIAGVPGATVDPSLVELFPGLHAAEPMGLLVEVYQQVRHELAAVLAARTTDRAASDAFTLAAVEANRGVDFDAADYQTVVGAVAADGSVLVGPHPGSIELEPVSLPAHIAGPAVTLFGPPDDPKMCIHAMNALHRVRPGEPALVAELVEASGLIPRWGADSEDSKTPFMADLLSATRNLAHCYARDLSFDDPRSGRSYRLAEHGLSVPIKRIPGIALPAATHFVDGNPLPMFLVDFVLHAWLNRTRPEALVFYVPKLENEAEAACFASVVRATEAGLKRLDSSFPIGTVRLFIVFETPRAIFRIREMASALFPYFAGGSLGWHDFLAATARLFRHDPNYRIPVKADPNIVIHHIKESHVRLSAALAGTGAVKIGGMYGTLYEEGNEASYQVSMAGYIRDVVSQFRRGLTGFWVAHPDFVRTGIALVEAMQRTLADASDPTLRQLATVLLSDADERAAVLNFLDKPDVDGLDEDHPLYLRAVLAADLQTSEVIRNDDPEEVRYNVFQALQYVAAWLQGTGCVALPAGMRNARDEPVFVRVMDDLATTERSRWELWAEVHHGRVSNELFEQILAEEIHFIQAGEHTPHKRVQVGWNERWYPIAVRLLRQLVTDPEPVEAVTELLLPFTLPEIRDAADPWQAALTLCPGRYRQ